MFLFRVDHRDKPERGIHVERVWRRRVGGEGERREV